MGKVGLNGNQLKMIALITMTLDHVGLVLMHDFIPFRIIGRLSFPIFAFMIAQGCRYTRHKLKYFLQIFLLGILCQTVFYMTSKSLYQGIRITFSLSILMIYAVQWAKKQDKRPAYLVPAAAIVLIFLLCEGLPLVLSTDFYVDYGFAGALLPVLVYLPEGRKQQLFFAGLGLLAVCITMGGYQWYSLFALLLLFFYNGEKGKSSIKYGFYIYYPVHLAVIYVLAELFVY